MSNQKSKKEKIKNIVIILLVLSAVVLGWESRLFGNSSADVGISELLNRIFQGAGDENDKKAAGAVMPVCIAVTDSGGVHSAVRYDMAELCRLYDKTVPILSGALHASRPPSEIDSSAWQSALTAPGVYFEYLSPVKLSVLSRLIGSEVSGGWGDIPVRCICVSYQNGKNRLLYSDCNTGKFYAANTAAPDGIESLTESIGISSSVFAFECGIQTLKNPYCLLMPDVSTHPEIEVKNPLTNEKTQADVLAGLGVARTNSPLTESGALVYVENAFKVRLLSDGTVIYRLAGDAVDTSPVLNESAAIEKAWDAVSASIGKYCGKDAYVYFDSVTRTEDNGYRVEFNYMVAGGRVRFGGDGCAATVTVKDGAITEMELRFRSFSVSDTQRELLPEIQAAAASSGTFMLAYDDVGSEKLEPVWIALPA